MKKNKPLKERERKELELLDNPEVEFTSPAKRGTRKGEKGDVSLLNRKLVILRKSLLKLCRGPTSPALSGHL